MSQNTDKLLASIRDGGMLTWGNKMNLIVGLSLPSILAQVTVVVMFYIDAAMVGHLGAQASAAIGIVETSTWLLGSLIGAASTGFSVQASHFIGAKDFTQARAVFRHGLLTTLVTSTAIGLLAASMAFRLPFWLGGGEDIAHDAGAYFLVWAICMPIFQLESLSGAMLKSTGDMRTPSLVSVATCVLDIIFNYLFIYILDCGVLGAAYGSAAALLVSAAILLYVALVKNQMISLRHRGEHFQWKQSYVKRAGDISIPIALQGTLMGGAQVMLTKIVAPLGNIAIAANSFAITAESLCYMPGYGIGDAASTLVGQTTGAGRFDLRSSLARMCVGLGMAVMAFMGILMFIFAPEMIGLLSPVPEIRDLGAYVLRIEAFAEPFFAAAIVTYQVCVGAGDTKMPTLMNLGSMWGVRIVLAALLAPHYGLVGVWVAMAIELTFRGSIFLVRLFRKFR